MIWRGDQWKLPDRTRVPADIGRRWKLAASDPSRTEKCLWYFDTSIGEGEILARRVGGNELAAIDVCYQLFNAEDQHYARASKGEHRYALQFIGDNDGLDGLFSSENGEQSASSLDTLIASAGVENGTTASHGPVPFNGYYFRILTAQGNNAEGGAKSYLVNGKMVSGFAFVAYPVVYRS
jgi:hypothetical protein